MLFCVRKNSKHFYSLQQVIQNYGHYNEDTLHKVYKFHIYNWIEELEFLKGIFEKKEKKNVNIFSKNVLFV